MAESRSWGSDLLQAEQLKQTINRSTGYVVESGLVADYPRLAEAAVIIRLDCVSEPTGEFARIVEVTTGGLRRLSITFVVQTAAHNQVSLTAVDQIAETITGVT